MAIGLLDFDEQALKHFGFFVRIEYLELGIS
jgi:hypothetical protein